MSNTLSPEAMRLLVSNVFYRAWNTTRRIFLNIYIFKFIGSLQILALFSISMLSFHLISFYVASMLVKKWYRNILSFLALFGMAWVFGTFSYDISIIKQYYFPLSIFMGICSGTYWCVNSNNQFDLTTQKNRGNFEWWKKTLRTINSLLTPLLIWYVISMNFLWDGYSIAFLLWSVFFLISASLSYVNPSHTRESGGSFQMKKLLWHVAVNKNIISIMCIVLLAWYALSTNIIEILAPLVLTDIGLNEFWIWAFISWVSLISILASYVFGKYVSYEYYKHAYTWAGLLYLLLISLILLFPTQLYFSLFTWFLALLYVFIDLPVKVFSSNYLHEIKDYKSLKSEYIFLKEVASNLSRIFVFIPIFFMSSLQVENLIFLFITMAFSVFISMILFMRLRIPNID